MRAPEGRRLLKAVERERARAVDPSANLRAQLAGMGVRQLRRYAFDRMQVERIAIDAEAMHEAERGDRPVEALTELLVQAMQEPTAMLKPTAILAVRKQG